VGGGEQPALNEIASTEDVVESKGGGRVSEKICCINRKISGYGVGIYYSFNRKSLIRVGVR